MFGPGAIIVDERIGCWLWQGALAHGTNSPEAGYDGRVIRVRREAYLRSGRAIPDGGKIWARCGENRCVNPDHLVIGRPSSRRSRRSRARSQRSTSRMRWTIHTLPSRPRRVTERHWDIFVRHIRGETYAAIGQAEGVSRQRIHQIVLTVLLRMPRPVERLTDEQLAVVAFASPTEATSALARRLGVDAALVRRFRRRLERAGGWLTPLQWATCLICDRPVAGGPGNRRRLVHLACVREYNRRYLKTWHQRHPTKRDPASQRDWRRRNPERMTLYKLRETARAKQEWAELSAEEKRRRMAIREARDRAGQEETLRSAVSRGQPWTRQDDDYVWEHLDAPARDVGLALGRTAWSVRSRRVLLRKQRAAPSIGRPKTS